MISVVLVLCVLAFLPGHLFTQNNEIRDIKALMEYDEQLAILKKQYKGTLAENVGFALLYHMREDRWKQGGDWESLDFTGKAIQQAMNTSRREDLSILLENDDIMGGEVNYQLLESLPSISEMELRDALFVHKIRLLTILGNYLDAQQLVDMELKHHFSTFGTDDALQNYLLHEEQLIQNTSAFASSKHKPEGNTDQFVEMHAKLKYLIEHRGLLYFVGGQSWLSSGDASSAIKWFENAIQSNPCLHQAYYQLAQAVAAGPHNNPRQLTSQKQGDRELFMKNLMKSLQSTLNNIYLNPETSQASLLRTSSQQFRQKRKLTSAWFWNPLVSLFSSTSAANDVEGSDIQCVFGDELQYFHILLQYSQVSSNYPDDADADLGEENEDLVGEMGYLLQQRAKITLKADHPAAYAQQAPSSPTNGLHSHSQEIDASTQSHVSRDYVQVVQAALYWSLFTIADALPNMEHLAFFYLQQARSLERFRVHHPLYSLYSEQDSQRQVAHILRTFTADYYPRPVYPDSLRMSPANIKDIDALLKNGPRRHHHYNNLSQPSVVFAHEMENSNIRGSSKSKTDDEDDDDERFYGSSIRRPVFIVGFFRSGSTLLETLLSKSHANIWGLGEHSAFATQMHRMQEDMLSLAERFEKQKRQYQLSASNGAKLQAVQEEMFRQMLRKHARIIDELMVQRCKQYVLGRQNNSLNADDDSGPAPPQCTRVIDKMLLNYRNIGLIHLIFPQAIILHTMRDPMDTLWSCMTHRFGDEAAYTLDYRLLVQEYILYLKTMHHFRNTLPARPPIWGRVINEKDEIVLCPSNEKKKASAGSEMDRNWYNVALCQHDANTRNEVSPDVFAILCQQQRHTRSGRHDTKLSLSPLIDVRYDAVVTRSTPLLYELEHLLELPSSAEFSAETNRADNETMTRSASQEAGTEASREKGPIRTASFLQVRRPVTSRAQGKWLRYAKYLKYNALALWREALASFSWDDSTDQSKDHSNTTNKKTKKSRKQKQIWRQLVPFANESTFANIGDDVAMNWMGDIDYDYLGHLHLLTDQIDLLLATL
jgi:hypothetical protein